MPNSSQNLWDDQGRVARSLIPSVGNVLDLGSPTAMYRKIYGTLVGDVIADKLESTPNGSSFIDLNDSGANVFEVPTGGSLSFSVNNVPGKFVIDFSGAQPVIYGPANTWDIGKVNAAVDQIYLNELLVRAAGGFAGTFTANGTTEVVVTNANWITGCVLLIGLQTVGGTPAAVYQSSSSTGVSFAIASAAGNTSVYSYVIISPF